MLLLLLLLLLHPLIALQWQPSQGADMLA